MDNWHTYDRRERATRLGRKPRQEIGRGRKMTTLKFHMQGGGGGGRGEGRKAGANTDCLKCLQHLKQQNSQ